MARLQPSRDAALSDRYTNSRGRRDLVEHDNPATRTPVLQAIEELATSRTGTEL
jgi:hypothetical protein